MKITSQELEKRAGETLRACLERVPFLKIRAVSRGPERTDMSPDFLVKLALPDGKRDLIAEVKNNGQPRVAREAVNQLLRYRERYPGAYGVFIAPYISPQAGEICSKAGIGYVDLSGNCRLCFDRVYIEQEGRPNTFARKRDLRSLYSPRAARVLRALLTNPPKAWKVQALAEEAQVSLGQVSNVKKLLSDREWVRVKPEGFVLCQPEALLKEWAENYSFRKNRVRDFYSLKNPTEIESDLASLCDKEGIRYALTGFSGAARWAPEVRYQRAMAYVGDAQADVVAGLRLKEAPSGANVTLLTPYDDGVFYNMQEMDGAQVASAVQIYLDLKGFRGRGGEAADALLERVIRPTW